MNHALHTAKTSLETLARELCSDGRGKVLLAVSAGWALSMGVRFVYPALVPFFRTEFEIGLSTIGLLLTLLWAAYALGHVPGGILGDRFGEGNILVISTVASTAAILVVATALDVWMFFAGTVAFGLATALYGPTRFTILTDMYAERAGSAIGLTMAAGNIGNTVFPAMAAFVATYLTWRLGFGAFLPLFVAVVLALWLFVPGRTSGSTSVVDEFSVDTVKRILVGVTAGSIPIFVLIQVTISFVIQGFASFYPTYLVAVKGLSPGVAASVFGLFFAVGAIIQPISGGVMDRLGARKTLILFLSSCVLALWLLPFIDGIAPLVVITVLFSTWNGCVVITQTYIADALPSDMQGTGFGSLKAGWMLIGATSPLLVGVLAEFGYFDEGFLLLAVVGTVGVGVLLVSLLRR